MEKEMAPHSSTLAWKIPWMEEPGRLQSMGRWGSDTTEWLHFHFSLSCIGEGSGTPLQCSCLENPRDRGAWWAAVYGVAQSQTRLKWLSRSSSSSSELWTFLGAPVRISLSRELIWRRFTSWGCTEMVFLFKVPGERLFERKKRTLCLLSSLKGSRKACIHRPLQARSSGASRWGGTG